MPVLDSIDELKLISTSSSILNDEDVRAFDCGYQELNDVFLDIYKQSDILFFFFLDCVFCFFFLNFKIFVYCFFGIC